VELWKHSIASGMVMQMISRDNMRSKHFMTGLLHDVGKMVIELKFAPFAKEINEIAVKERRPRQDIEREIIGITHAEIGQEIAQMWDMPNELVESIAFHHMPAQTQRHKLLSSLVYLADVFVRKMDMGQSGNYSPPTIDDEFAQKVKLRVTFEEVNAQREDILGQISAITES
jgi:putative nucleotidyltransferase with HDIG domain